MTLRTRRWDGRGNGGLAFTELGFGGAPLGNLYRAIPDREARAILDAAWAGGARYYDTAPLYGFGLSETRMNVFLRDKPREDYVLSTKVGRRLAVTTPETRDGIGKWFDVPARKEIYDYTHDGVMRSFEASFERLGVDRVDLLYVHDIDLRNQGSEAALDASVAALMDPKTGGHAALVKLREEGVIRAFGVGVNEWEISQRLAKAGDFDIFLLAGRYTLLEQDALETFLPLCERRGLGVVIGGPYNSGVLATGPREDAWYDYDRVPKPVLDRVARIDAVCRDHGVPMLHAAFRFPLLHPSVLTVIPGGQSVAEMEANLEAARADIPAALWADLKAQGLMRQDAPTGA